MNYRDPGRTDPLLHHTVRIGEVRYASTNRAFQGITNVPVDVLPGDLLGQKTALFGMTRTGKSNTTKMILQSVFHLRFDEQTPARVGQLVFDPNGEYANENVQDQGNAQAPAAIKNVWRSHQEGREEDVVTYGMVSHPNDPNRKLMLINFFEDDNLQIGKTIINGSLADDSTKFIGGFRQVRFQRPDPSNRSAITRYGRQVGQVLEVL